MSLLSRHILRVLAAPFVWGVLALTGMLLLNSLASLIDRLGGKGLDWHIMSTAILLALPALMVLTLPMAVLSATLYAYGQLAADMELVAMYANGISVWRMVRPALIGAFGVFVFNFILFDQFVPRSNAQYKALLLDIQQAHPTLTLKPKQLNSLSPTSYYISADSIGGEGNEGYLRKVTIFDLGGFNPQRVIIADSGQMKMDPGGNDMLLTLYRGEIIEFPPNDPGRVQRTTFLSDRFRLRGVTNQLQRNADIVRGRGDREMSGCELMDGIDDQNWYLSEGLAAQQLLARRDLRRLERLTPTPPRSAVHKPAFPRHCGLYRKAEDWLERRLLSATALAAQVQDSVDAEKLLLLRQAEQQRNALNDMGKSSFRDNSNISLAKDSTKLLPPVAGALQLNDLGRVALPNDTLRAQLGGDSANAIVPPLPQETVTTFNEVLSARLDVRGAQMQLAAYKVELYKKWAIPLSSFCFVLLGLALALRNPRGGIGMVIGGSLVIFMIFYVLIIGAENLAKKLLLDPLLGMLGPLLLFTLFGLLSVAAANREMGAARSTGMLDRIGDFFRRHRKKVTK